MMFFSRSLPLLAVALGVGASQFVLNDGTSAPSDFEALYRAHPDYSIDLNALRRIQLSPSDPPVVVPELVKIKLKAQGLNFLDITESADLGSFSHLRASGTQSYPDPSASSAVKSVIKTLNTHGMEENLKKFTSFRTRYYRSDTGRQSQLWLLSKIQTVTAESASEELQRRINIAEFPHSWGQNTIIVKINGTESDEVVVVSAHQDSTNMWPFLPAPGADDDGSGTMSILEAYRGLISAGFSPKRTVEFHFYSAEEGGLLGSQAVAAAYERQAVPVVAMSQFDMTAWVKRGTREAVGVITDFVDSPLTEFNKKLIDAYLSIPYVETKCGYACSDHASWSKAGYPAIFTIESSFEDSNKNIHSGNDRIDISDEFSFDHMLEFSKLATAFAIELGQWEK